MNLISAFALFALAFASVNAAGCSSGPISGCLYNLSNLSIPMNSPVTDFYSSNVTSGEAMGFYNWNICGALNSTICGGSNDTAVCQTTGGVPVSAGAIGSETWSSYAGQNQTTCPGVSLTYGGGAECVNAGIERTTTISIACNPLALSPVTLNVTEPSTCVYIIMMESAEACGEAAPMPTESPSPSVTVTVMSTMTMTMTTTVTPTATMAAPVVNTMTTTITPTMSASVTMMNPTGTNATISVTTTASPTASLSAGASVSPSPSAGSPAADDGDTDSNTWIWWVVGGIAIVVIVAAIAAAGFVVYKKKQQSYDSIGYE